MIKKTLIILLLVTLLLLTGCKRNKVRDDSRVILKTHTGEEVTLRKVCIDGFVYIYGGCTLTPKIKYQDSYGPVIERCVTNDK